ncbi:hypothetical protein MAR_013422 [Mya arenaria]|uniref:Uncharacterized protein n=1 Tax=Mya arenaria TaxID=6604 RepID=A0ABY7FZS9_MYAAR|nr:hypothetical protein MAR_013422 [Mya arenaria]
MINANIFIKLQRFTPELIYSWNNTTSVDIFLIWNAICEVSITKIKLSNATLCLSVFRATKPPATGSESLQQRP